MTTLTAATPTMTGQLSPGQGMPRQGPPTGGGLSGADVLRIIRQRLLMIIVLWFLFSAAGVAFSVIMRFYYPKYAASSLIRIESINPASVTDPLKKQIIREKEIERELQNQVLLVTSSTVLQKALGDPDLRRTIWFKEAEEEAKEKNDSVVDLLSDILSASPIRDSNYIRVAAAWRVPSELPTIVNTVVQKYVAEIDRQQKNSIRGAEEQLTSELDRSKKYFESKKQEIENFRQTAEFSTFTSQEANETLLTLTSLVTELEVDMLGRKTQWETLKNATPEDLPITADLQAILRQDPAIQQLEQERLIAEGDMEAAKQQFGPKHLIVQRSTKRFEAAAERVEQERALRMLDYQKRQIDQAQRNFLEAQDQLLALKERLYEAKAVQRDKDIKKARYESLLDERDLLRTQYESLLDKKNLLSMTLRQKRTVQIVVQSSAIEPKRISSPDLKIWIPIGCVLGMALALGLAFLIELTDNSVRTPRDIMRTQLAVLGTIPSTDDDEVDIERVETASLDAPHSIIAEAFRSLRANLFFSAPAEQQGVILITSPSGGNGKTAVASNLAISMALSGRRVLLVDANFRRASLPRVFPNMKPQGLSNILVGQGELNDFVAPTSVPGLDVLSAGPIPPNPAELLGSSYLRDVVVDARSQYDQVIFDGPPVLLVSDAIVLAGAVDGCLLVCQYRSTSRGALQRTQSSLHAINARIFGAVLNRVQSRAGGYFRKSYREFYEYQEPDEDAQGSVPALKLDATVDAAATESGQSPRPPDDDQTDGSGGQADSTGDVATASDMFQSTGVSEAEAIQTGEPMDDLPDLGDVEDLDIIEDHDLESGDGLIAAGEADEVALPELQIPELGGTAEGLAEPDLGAITSDLDSGEVATDDLSNLDSDEFKLDDSATFGDDSEDQDMPDEEGSAPSP